MMMLNISINPASCLCSDGEVPFHIRLSGDYAVDLYFVIDFSGSMRPYKNNLREAAVAITDEITKVTSDYMIGFGGFIEKPILPFAGS